MSIFNAFVAYKFLKILSMPFEKTDAYKEGVIDKKGNQIIPRKEFNHSQQMSYTIFHHLIYKLKKIMNKVPVLKSRIGSFAAALWFIKETIKEEYDETQAQLIEETFISYLTEQGYDVKGMMVNESFSSSTVIEPGIYIYNNKEYNIARSLHSFDNCLNIPLFKLDENTIIAEADIKMKKFKEFKEEIAANNAGAGNIAGLGSQPPVSKKNQKIHRRKASGVTADNVKKESVELDEDNTAAVAKQVKQAVKKYTTGKLVVRSKGGKSRFIMVRADKIDNELRKKVLNVVAPKANVRDKSNISYGNISDNIISASVEQWMKALGLKESVKVDEAKTPAITFIFPDERKAKQFDLDIENSSIGLGNRVGKKVTVTGVQTKWRAAVKKAMLKNKGKLVTESVEVEEAKDNSAEQMARHKKALQIIKFIDSVKKHKEKWTDSFGDYVTPKLNPELDLGVKVGVEYQQGRGRGDWSFIFRGDNVGYNNKNMPWKPKSGTLRFDKFMKLLDTWKKEILRESVEVEESTDTFAGSMVFSVTSEEYNKCFHGRSKNERWKRKLNMDEMERCDIRTYHHKNPSKSIIVQNERTGEMTYLVKGETTR